MGEFMRIEFEYNGAYDPRSDKTDGNRGHLYWGITWKYTFNYF